MGKLTQTISRDYRSLDENSLAGYVLRIGQALPGVPGLSGIKPAAADGIETGEQFTKAIASALNGGMVAVARKNECKQQTLHLLDAWTAYAVTTMPDSPLQWMEAGFRLTKDASVPAQPLPTPPRFSTAEGSSRGSVRVSQKAQAGAKAYITEYALVPKAGEAPVWLYCLCSKSECEITGLTSKAEYLFRGAAWNGTGTPVFSAIETRMVQ